MKISSCSKAGNQREVGIDKGSKLMSFSFSNALKACSKKKDLLQGDRLHSNIRDNHLPGKKSFIGNNLVRMYAKCGALVRAKQAFDELSVRDVTSWRTLISGYTKHGHSKEALSCFYRMKREGSCPDVIIYSCILKACSILQDLDSGKKVHDEIISQNLLAKDFVLGTALVDMYAKCGKLMRAREVLDELPVQSVSSWSALIAGYARQGQGKEALGCYRCMRSNGFFPDAIAYACTLKACSLTQDIELGTKIHNEIVCQRLLSKDVKLGTALVDMFAKCGLFEKAHNILNELFIRDVASWNAMITGYVHHGCGLQAIDCFHQMQREGQSPDAITYAGILKACSIAQDIGLGKKIHDEVALQGLLLKHVALGTALIDMYAKLGSLKHAQSVFNELPARDATSWNALMSGYVQHGYGKEALECFQSMRKVGLSPGPITYACILKGCGITENIIMGKTIHDEIVSQGLLEKNEILGSALVDMYVKCGVLSKAQTILENLPVRSVSSWSALVAGYAQQGDVKAAFNCFQLMRGDGVSPNVVSWNALLGGYAQKGLAKEALDCFLEMQWAGVVPDSITFVHLLNACSHSGLVDEGQLCFNNMRENYGIWPCEEHYTCMVDLYGRARLFDKAMQIISIMPSSDCPAVWSALLGDCRNWVDAKVGRMAFDRLVQLDGCNSAAYVSMSNIYAADGMCEEALNIERMGVENAVIKRAGFSC